MKLVFIAAIGDFRMRQGLAAKTFSQLRFLRETGLEILPLIVLDIASREDFERRYPREKAVFIEGYHKGSISSVLSYQHRLYTELRDRLSGQTFDYIYMRYPDSDWNLASFASKFSGKIVFEHHAKELEALAALCSGGPLPHKLHACLELISERTFSRSVLKHAAACIGVTEEIAIYEKARSGRPALAAAAIANGTDCSQFPLRTAPAFDGKQIRLLLVADIRPYHGLDRLLRSLSIYSGPFHFQLHVAG
ncbi:MAG TPA: hypothetical protein PLL10_09665, partial [Elusimicrobiales bacterium]|nr:hypothetical protein [Elusimicrobiales bacterium]